MNTLTQFVAQFQAAWAGSDLTQRLVLMGAMAAVALGLGSVVFYTGQGDMAVLYSGLADADAAAVVEALREQNIPYRVRDTGNAIEVPRGDVAETRLLLAQAGLPFGSGVGFELFDRSEFGITDFAQKVNFKRAIEGELARTINHMDEVRFARIQLAIPERRLFGQDQAEPTAAVFLALRPGRTLNRGQVSGIQHLVSSSVERLSPHNITITDQHANALAAPSDPGSAAALSASQLELRRAVEQSLEAKVRTILDTVVGPRRSAVAVTAAIDFDRVERTEERFNPQSQVVRSEERQSEKSSMTQPDTGGAVGLTANLPTATNVGAAGGAGGSTKKSDSSLTNYEIDKTVEHIVKSPGTITGLSVSVVVDGTYTVPDGGGEKTYQPRSEDDMANLKRVVLAAVGNTGTTTVEVLNVPLDTTVQEAERAAQEEADRQRLYDIGTVALRYVVIAVVALVAFGFVRRMVATMAQRPSAVAVSAGASVAAGGVSLDLMSGAPTDTETKTTQLQELSKQQPENLAALVKSWMVER